MPKCERIRIGVLRRTTQLSVLALFLLGPWAGLWIIKGNLNSSLALDVLPLSDPFVLVQSWLAGLQFGAIAPTDIVECRRAFSLNGKTTAHLRCNAVHGDTDLRKALVQSCNVYFQTVMHGLISSGAEARFRRAKVRFRRSGAHNIETRMLRDERDPWLKRRKQAFDRALVDAPCSGSSASSPKSSSRVGSTSSSWTLSSTRSPSATYAGPWKNSGTRSSSGYSAPP